MLTVSGIIGLFMFFALLYAKHKVVIQFVMFLAKLGGMANKHQKGRSNGPRY